VNIENTKTLRLFTKKAYNFPSYRPLLNVGINMPTEHNKVGGSEFTSTHTKHMHKYISAYVCIHTSKESYICILWKININYCVGDRTMNIILWVYEVVLVMWFWNL
jgi:hypothetical protein